MTNQCTKSVTPKCRVFQAAVRKPHIPRAAHDLSFVEERGDRAALPIEGRVAAEGTSKEAGVS
jgi:hypothetical protein